MLCAVVVLVLFIVYICWYVSCHPHTVSSHWRSGRERTHQTNA